MSEEPRREDRRLSDRILGELLAKAELLTIQYKHLEEARETDRAELLAKLANVEMVSNTNIADINRELSELSKSVQQLLAANKFLYVVIGGVLATLLTHVELIFQWIKRL